MDTTKAITHVSLCAGYGGIDLGLRRVLPALRTIAYAEREGFCCANLVSKAEAGLMDAAPIWTDVKTFPWAEFRDRVDILSGGYPCQPFSAAGKRLGAEDPRHLWPHISAGIALMRPSVCFFENVEGHISLGLSDVLQDLVGLGYKPTWCVASASECGAPHQRKRVFILAYRHGERGQLPDWWRVTAEQVPVGYGETWRNGELVNANGVGSLDEQQSAQGRGTATAAQSSGTAWPSRPGEQQLAWEPPRVVVDAKSQRANRRPNVCDEECGSRRSLQSELNDTSWAAERQTQPPLGRDADGPADWLDHAELYTTCDNRTDELRLLGNGVVPATCERAFRVLVGELMEHENP